jgi:Ca2+-transporting ATPase
MATQLNNFVVILLIVASVISALLGDYVEAIAIMAIVVVECGAGYCSGTACGTGIGCP